MENGKTNEPGVATGLPQASQDLEKAAQHYGQRISEAATHAKDFVTDKVSVVGDKFRELQQKDVKELASNAKEYARKNPGQAILISAAAGLILGFVLRGRR